MSSHALRILPFLCVASLASSGCASEAPSASAEASAAAAPTSAAPVGAAPCGAGAACGSDPAGHGAHAAAGPQPLRAGEDGSQLFGSELDGGLETTALSSVFSDPSGFQGRTVRTEGVITAVCQRMGCWMELRADDGTEAVRVPMAGHSFFLPRDVAGRRATVQGRVDVRALDPATQEHLRSEGAQAAGQTIGIQATAVLVHAAG